MLLMHARAESNSFKSVKEDTVLPIGKWYDLRVEGAQLLAQRDFDAMMILQSAFRKKVE